MKTSIPKLHSIKYKNGTRALNVVKHPDASSHVRELIYHVDNCINEHGHNMSLAEVVGCLEFVKRDLYLE